MQVVSVLSRQPDLADAIRRAWDEALDRLGGDPGLVLLFFSDGYETDAIAIENAIRPIATRCAVVGGAAPGVIAGCSEIQDGLAVSLLAVRAETLSVSSFSVTETEIEIIDDPDLTAAHVDADAADTVAILLLCDPFTIHAGALLGVLNRAFPAVPIVGGLIGGASAPGTAALLGPEGVHTIGAVGVAIRGALAEAIVCQGCRPIGEPLLITRARNNLIYELGRRPAFDVLRETVDGIEPDERSALEGALHIGRVIDEYADEFNTGDFLVRNLIGADPDQGVIAVGDVFNSGQTVQFHVRDSAAAEAEMRRRLRSRAGRLRDVLGGGGGCLMLNCAGRGAAMFGLPDHDAALLSSEIGSGPVAGCFCSGEIGPAGKASSLHSFTNVILALGGA